MLKLKMPSKPTDYILWGVGLAAVYVIADSMGIFNSLKGMASPTAATPGGVNGNGESRVAYYNDRRNVPLPGGVSHVAFTNAYIGDAYNLGTSSMTGDYNGIPMANF